MTRTSEVVDSTPPSAAEPTLEPGPTPQVTGRAGVGATSLYFETFGSGDEHIVVVCGLASQLVSFPAEFCGQLAAEGYTVVRFDNRDVGLSSTTDGPPPRLRRAGNSSDAAPYGLSEMAADVVGILDHLGVERAHVVGVSMGGMIVQHLAIEYGERLLSATSIMSTTGAPDVGRPTEEAYAALLTVPPTEVDAAAEHAADLGRIWGGPHFDVGRARALARLAHARGARPEAAQFHLAAVRASGDRTERLRQVDVPFLVIHGLEDTLIDLDGGEATALAVPGAKLRVMADLGHALAQAPALWTRLVRGIVRHAQDSVTPASRERT